MSVRRLVLAACAACALFAAGCGPKKERKEAPDVGIPALLQSPDASLKSLSGLRGQTVVLEFWATWCGPCRESLPHMNKMIESFKGKPVRFISVTREPREDVERFLRAHPMNASIGLDPDGVVHDAFRVRGIPDIYVIDPHGRIWLRIQPSFLYKSDIEAAMKAPPPPVKA
ncbi:MAG: TlpA family protein disulfide reductase [Elusimicrobia bacterium]|nr:TlpA family protein disulfide reductase [Elusimicrobiota bacterium]